MVALMYERGKRETELMQHLQGWTVVPLENPIEGVENPICQLGNGLRLPRRFGGWWRHNSENDRGDVMPDGREIVMWFKVDDGRVNLEEITFRGIEDEWERFGVPAMRDMLTLMFSVRSAEGDANYARDLASAPLALREKLIGETRRRRRTNSVNLERVAELYAEGGVAAIRSAGLAGSDATAYRHVAKARAAGVLPPRDR
jgi:hypothetical protein